jgi:hypothetical protein
VDSGADVGNVIDHRARAAGAARVPLAKELVMRHARTVAVSVVVGSSAAVVALLASATPALAQVVQAPVHVPVNVCGNSISIIGLLNPAFGNKCVNE